MSFTVCADIISDHLLTLAMVAYSPERLLVKTIVILDFVESMLLEGSFNPVQDIKHMMLFGSVGMNKNGLSYGVREHHRPPWPKPRC